MNRAARDCDRSDRRRAARRDVQFYHVGVPQRFHSEETLSEGAEILSGTPNAPTVARFRLVESSVPPGSGVLLLCVELVSPNTEIFETTLKSPI